ncbi:MAG: DNA repair protein RecO [bacterium]
MKFNEKAIVLRGFNYADNDRIIRLLTENKGKSSAIAKGARKEKSKLREAIEIITYSNFQLNSGRNMYTISQAEIICPFFGIKNSLEGLMTATLMCELADEFMEEGNPDRESHDLLLRVLYMMNDRQSGWGELELYFEVHMHILNGIFPDFYQCVNCGSTDSGNSVKLDLDNGGVLCSKCSLDRKKAQVYPMKALFILDAASKKSMEEILSESWEVDSLLAARKIIAQFSSYYLGKELKSRKLFEQTIISTE